MKRRTKALVVAALTVGALGGAASPAFALPKVPVPPTCEEYTDTCVDAPDENMHWGNHPTG
ncbi:hypothetical protein [Herbidospora mongoliensis]|uniref:hypothetical protein n=1 Tax=Herbidospora mongoliensis TaxID=688067 RepID=UPI0012FAC1C2|nr:hypothetical protein [Herbidospora mongoliensis]